MSSSSQEREHRLLSSEQMQFVSSHFKREEKKVGDVGRGRSIDSFVKEEDFEYSEELKHSSPRQDLPTLKQAPEERYDSAEGLGPF